VDNFAIRSEFDVNTSDVPKFELSQEKYAQRTGEKEGFTFGII
jgi:hypothetical protein